MKGSYVLAVLVLLGSLLGGFDLSAQKKYDKMMAKTKSSYESGRYDKAASSLAKFKTKATKKLGADNKYMLQYYLQDARLKLVSGELKGFDESLQNAEKAAISSFGENSETYAYTLLDIAQIYSWYGNYRLSREYCAKAEDLMKSANLKNDELQGRMVLEKAEALTGQGFCNDAIRLLRENENFYVSRATPKQTSVVDGKIVTSSLSESERTGHYSDYARYLILVANAYSRKGDLRSADSAFTASQTWIKKNQRYLSETNLSLVENNYLYRTMFNENGNRELGRSLKELEYDNMLSELKSHVTPTTPLAQDIYTNYLVELLKEENRARYANVKAEYSRTLDKYFDKKSLVQANLDAVEFEAKFSKDQAEKSERSALALIKKGTLPKTYKTTVKLYEFLYEVAISEQKYQKAETYLDTLSDIKKDLYGNNTPEYHLAQTKLACFYLDYTNKLQEAAQIFENSYTKVLSKEIGDWHKDHLEILSHLAKAYEYTDQYDKAIATLNKASDIARAKFKDDDPDYAVALDGMAQLQIKLGLYDEAEGGVKKAIQILTDNRKDGYAEQYVHSIETQARLFGIKGQFDDAEDNLDKTRKIIRKSKVAFSDNLSTKEELSSLLIQLGRYRSTESLLKDLIPAYEKIYGSSSFRLIESLVNEGSIQLASGDYTAAEKTAARANQIAISVYGENSTKAAPTQKLLSDLYYTLGDYEKAEENINKAIQSQEKQFGRKHIDVARSISKLALIKFHKGDDAAQIEKLMVEAREIISSKLGTSSPQYAEIMKNMAVLFISENRISDAFNALTVAEGIWKAKSGSKNNINLASIYTLTGDVYYQQQNYPKSIEFYNKSKDLYEKFFSNTHPEYIKVLSKLSRVYYMLKDYKQSKKLIEQSLGAYENFIKNYFPALSDREKTKYWNTIRGDFEFYNTLALGNLDDFKDLTSNVYNYQLLTKALLLNSSIKIRERILNSNDEDLKAKYSLWLTQKEQLTLALSMSPEQLLEAEIDPVALQGEVEGLEKELSQKSELFSQSFDDKKITYQDVQKVLKPNEVAIEIVRYRYFDHTFTDSVVYAALYIRNDKSKPKAIILGDGSRLENRFFKYYRNAIISKIPDQVSYDQFWGPIQKALGQTSTIYLSADGVYNQINLEAIPTPDGKYVIDNSNIVLVSNTRDLYLRSVKTRPSTEHNTASMFGNPTFYLTASTDNKIAALPGTEKEVTQLQDILKKNGWVTSEFVEKAATEDNVKIVDSPKIFHVATHGFYQPSEEVTLEKEMESDESTLANSPLLHTGLLLKGAGDLLNKTDNNYNIENGILTAYEAMNLNLDRTDLVVLSACETGLGEVQAGEGVYGLQRAFLVAGAKVLIMSMFKVDDDATQKLMLKFYQKWLTTGNMRQSFTDAKKEIRVDYPEPIYWGAFMMIGLD